MKVRNINLSILLLIFILSVLAACTPAEKEIALTEETTTSVVGHVLWVDSYALDYPWSMDLQEGIQSVFAEEDIELHIVHMDTKNNPSDDYCAEAAEAAYTEIETINPDILIVTDDNVQRCLVVPYLMDSEIPIIFAAVNWDASSYGYPNEHITGMIEVELVEQTVEMLSEYADGDLICYLVSDNTTDRKREEIFAERFAELGIVFHFVTNYEEFQTEFLKCQDEYDMMLLGGNGGIEDWDAATVETFILDNIKIPIGTRETFMAPYALLALAKTGQEQGQWAAEAALQVLQNTPIAEIPVVENQIGLLILNLNVASALDVAFPPAVLRSANDIYGVE